MAAGFSATQYFAYHRHVPNPAKPTASLADRWRGNFAVRMYQATMLHPEVMRARVMPLILVTHQSTLQILHRLFLLSDLDLYARLLDLVKTREVSKNRCAAAMASLAMGQCLATLTKKPHDAPPVSPAMVQTIVDAFHANSKREMVFRPRTEERSIHEWGLPGGVASQPSEASAASGRPGSVDSPALSGSPVQSAPDAVSQSSRASRSPAQAAAGEEDTDENQSHATSLRSAGSKRKKSQHSGQQQSASSDREATCMQWLQSARSLFEILPVELWLEDERLLPAQDQGGMATVGEAILLTEQEMLQWMQLSSKAKRSRIGRRCFWKQTHVDDHKRLRLLMNEKQVLDLIRVTNDKSLHLPLVYGPAYRRIELPVDGSGKKKRKVLSQAMAMEVIYGEMLWRALAEEAIGWTSRERFQIALQLVQGVQYLQSLSIIHRDLTPFNVMVCSRRIWEKHPRWPRDHPALDASRCLKVDGVTHPQADCLGPPEETPDFRVVIIDFNNSFVLKHDACTEGLEAAQTFRAGLTEYQASTWRRTPRRRSSSEELEEESKSDREDGTAAAAAEEEDVEMSQASTIDKGLEFRFWLDYDLFGLGMTIADLLRGCTCEFKNGSTAALRGWSEYYAREAADGPSVLEWLCKRADDLSSDWWKAEGSFVAANKKFAQLMEAHTEVFQLLVSITRPTRDQPSTQDDCQRLAQALRAVALAP
jgi:hypothetical protein